MPSKRTYCDVDGTITGISGNQLIITPFYLSLQNQTDPTKTDYSERDFVDNYIDLIQNMVNAIPHRKERLTPGAKQYLIAQLEEIKKGELDFVFVTKNRKEYISALLQCEGFSSGDIKLLTKNMLDIKNVKANGGKDQSVYHYEISQLPVKTYSVFDDSPNDRKAMQDGIIRARKNQATITAPAYGVGAFFQEYIPTAVPNKNRDLIAKDGVDYCQTDESTHAGATEIQGRRELQEDRLITNTLEGFNRLSDKNQQEAINQTVNDINLALPPYEQVGSTACVAIAWIDVSNPQQHQLKIKTANLGDSTAYVVILKNGKYHSCELINKNLHNPAKNHAEVKRSISAGNTIIGNRVNGVLAVSRSFGDRDILLGAGDRQADIDSVSIPLDNNQRAFIVVGCDGMTDPGVNGRIALTSENIGHLVAKYQQSPEEASYQLVKAAYESGVVDNISVAVTPIKAGRPPIVTAIFDGHGGDYVSQYLYDNFHKILSSNVNTLIKSQTTKPQAHPHHPPKSITPPANPAKIFTPTPGAPTPTKEKKTPEQPSMQALPKTTQEVISGLEKYIERIESYRGKKPNGIDYEHGFLVMKGSRAQNREANYKLARDLANQLKAGDKLENVFSEKNLRQMRAKYKHNRGIHSTELIKVIKHAKGSIEKNRFKSTARPDIALRRKR